MLLRRADAALYQAKRNGRDSFVCDTTHADDAIEAISDEVTVNAAEAADAAEGSGGLGRARRDR